ncbi:MAG TPA: hypothetical protein VHS28_07500, partial [Chloroflexota bacterium]|nr:hypothetical protein [Chloroflexota bacterium]
VDHPSPEPLRLGVGIEVPPLGDGEGFGYPDRVVGRIDTTTDAQLWNFLKDVEEKREAGLGDWENPRGPESTNQ